MPTTCKTWSNGRVSTQWWVWGRLLLREIDLSIGSVVGLVAVVLAFCLKYRVWIHGYPLGYLGLSLLIGLVHGLLVTKAESNLLWSHFADFWFTEASVVGWRITNPWPVPLEGDKVTNLEQIQGLDFIFSGKIPLRILQPTHPFYFGNPRNRGGVF